MNDPIPHTPNHAPSHLPTQSLPVLFDANAIGVGMFLGSGFAAGLLLMINEVRLGRSVRGVVYLTLGVCFTLAYMAFAYKAPESISTLFMFINMGVAFGVKAAAQKLYAEEYARREGTEFMGKRGLAALIGILCAVMLVGGLYGWMTWQETAWLDDYTCTSSAPQGDEKICHKEGVTPEQSACIREGFTHMQFFDGSKTSHNFVERTSPGEFELSMIVQDGTQNNAAAMKSFEFIRAELQRMCFSDHTLTLNLWNPERVLMTTVSAP